MISATEIAAATTDEILGKPVQKAREPKPEDPGGLTTTYVFVNGGLVTVARPAPTSATISCATIYLLGQRPLALPLLLDRIAR